MRKKTFQSQQNKKSARLMPRQVRDMFGTVICLSTRTNEMMRPHKVIQGGSIALPLTVGAVVVAAAATLVGYPYQRKREKKQKTAISSLNQQNNLDDQSKTQKPEEV